MIDTSEMLKKCERLEARNREIDDMFLSLYTDKAKGKLSEQRFMKLTGRHGAGRKSAPVSGTDAIASAV